MDNWAETIFRYVGFRYVGLGFDFDRSENLGILGLASPLGDVALIGFPATMDDGPASGVWAHNPNATRRGVRWDIQSGPFVCGRQRLDGEHALQRFAAISQDILGSACDLGIAKTIKRLHDQVDQSSFALQGAK